MSELQQLLDQLPFPAFVTDGSGRTLMVNRAAALRAGTDPTPGAEQAELASLQAQLIGQAEQLQNLNYSLQRERVDRLQQEQAVRESQTLYSSLIENLPVHVIRKDLAGRFSYVSPSFCELLGKPEEAILNGTDLDLYPAELAEKYRQDDRQVMQTGETYETVEENRVGGETRYMAVLKSPVRSAAGQVIGVQIIFWDVTQRARAERALEQERYLLHALMDNLPHNIYFKDRQGRFIRINRALAKCFGGAGAADAIGKTDFDYFSAEHAEQAEADEQEILRSGQPIIDREERETWLDGRVTWALSTKMPLYDDQGHTIGTFGVSRDITAEKEAERQLRFSELKYRTLYNSSRDAIMLVTPGKGFLSGNPAALELFGCPDEDAFTRCTPADLSPPLQPDGETSAVKAQRMMALALDKGAHFFEWTHRRLDGPEFHATVLLARMALGDQVLLQATVRDITDQKRAADSLRAAMQAAEAASRAKSDFLARMSHEIRTPMNAILGMTELVLDTPLTSVQREYLQMVCAAGDALLGVINDILDFSKIEAGKLELHASPFRLREEVGDIMKSLAVRAHEKGLELACRIRPEVPEYVLGDLGRFRQILVNLVGNGIKFTEQGEVLVDVGVDRLESDTVDLHLAVSDTGIGIPADKLEAVFDAFEQVDRFQTRRFGGTGLGLAICSRLVELLRGRIWVESQEECGSTFHFTACLQILSADQFPPLVPAHEPCLGARVLVVDDNATNRRILEELLRTWGLLPISASGGAEALRLLHEQQAAGQQFDLVLSDGHMPHMSGFELIEKIRQTETGRETAIILLSSSDQFEERTRCERLGVAARLLKPLKQRELREVIGRALAVSGRSLPPAPAQGPQPAPACRLPPLRVLLAEDSMLNQRLAVALLEKQGHRVSVVADGAAAVEAVAGESFDLVLMDLQMPVMDGLEATAQIRAAESRTGRHIPIIAMTAHALKGDREHCLAAGMDGYVAKPVRAAELLQTVSAVLARSGRDPDQPGDDACGGSCLSSEAELPEG